MESTEITTTAPDAAMLEKVLVSGDLSKISPADRLQYYQMVCKSMGLNPLSRPFEYIELKGRLTLYAKKDATDQLRKNHGVSIDDIDIQDDKDGITVKVKGHDQTGRSDVEIGCVSKSDAGWSVQNVKMKAVTKAKRRLTLSLCGLGWLDESEIETIRDARPVIVDSTTGEIVQNAPQPAELPKGNINTPAAEKPAEAQEKPKFDEIEFLKKWRVPADIPVMKMQRKNAESMVDSKGKPYGEKSTYELYQMFRSIANKIPTLTDEQKPDYQMKISAICEIMQCRKVEKTLPKP